MDYAIECPNRSVAAVTHSVLLRFILASLLDVALLQAASTLRLDNAGVAVIDLDLDGSPHVLSKNSNVFGGGLSLAPSDYRLSVPESDVVRINEKRHLFCLERRSVHETEA